VSMQAGPGNFVSCSNEHLRFITRDAWLDRWLLYQDILQTAILCPVLLGVAIAAGLESDSTLQP
jgi:hypothetical protein